MKLLRALVAAALLAASGLAHAAIAFVAGSTNFAGGGTSQTVTLPTGYNTAGDITVVSVTESTTGTITVPSGWTTVYNGNSVAVVYRFYQTSDPSSITFLLGTSSTWAYTAATYSGVDSTTPVDASGVTVVQSGLGSGSNSSTDKYAQLMKWPSVNPTYSTDQLILTGGYGSFAGAKPSTPSGFTSRETQNGETVSVLFDQALASTANTGENIATGLSYGTAPFVGVTVALKTSGASHATPATPRATVSGLFYNVSSSGTSCPVTLQNVSNGALVAVFAAVGGTGTVTPPSGYTSVQSGAGGGLWTHTWQTGDTTSPSFTITSNPCNTLALTLVGAGSASTPIVDQSGLNASATSVSVSALTPTGSNADYAWFVAWLKTTGSTANSGLGPGTMTTDSTVCSAACEAVLQQQSVTSSLGPFTASIDGGSVAQVGVAALFAVPSSAVATQPVLILN